MSTTGWLILATFLGPIAGALAATGLLSGILRLAQARAERVEHVEVSGADLYARGVPMDEAQFRAVFAAMQTDLDQLPPSGERSEWDMQRQYHAVNRLSMLAGTFPQAFPMLGTADQAWAWYRDNGPYTADQRPC